MKKCVLLAFIFILTFTTSCSVESNEEDTFYLEVLTIDSVEMPEQFILGQTYSIAMTYTVPNLCYQFNDFIYEVDQHERTVAIVNTVYPNSNCINKQESVTVSFNFTVSESETYVFKFYQGKDKEGVDQYYFVEVPVETGD